ncbi:LysR family transcriptional regulator [Salinimonas lutimaris]|uniref:LysR family transcriptional regulator n=1 Tax=Salinimonas lutimaris TaxID=914153 RepID=UPI0010C13FB8|nr:LysR substrate-binding domain-containing protein [Salinimonas lutimaris]
MEISLKQLRCASQIYKYSNLSKAAEALFLTQSAVTQNIKKMEDSLNTRLFDRHAAGMQATVAGQAYLQRTARALQFLSDAAQSMYPVDKHAREHFERSITVRQLSALIALTREPNYTQAARTLNLTQPTLHRTIKELEKLCDQPLFQRSFRGVDVSRRARHLRRFAGLFFAELEQAADELASFGGQHRGRLKIATLPLARTMIVPDTVLTVMKRYPHARVNITDGAYDEQLQALRHGDCDILIGALRGQTEDITEHPLFDDTLSVVVRHGHPLANVQHLSLQQWLALKWVVPREHTPARNTFHAIFDRMGLAVPSDIIECSSLVVTRGLLMQSDRAALLPARQVSTDVAAGCLAVSPVPLFDSPRPIGYSVRANWQPTLIQQHFIDLLTARHAQT